MFYDRDGNKISLKEFDIKTLFIAFWATWCGPCLGEKTELKKLKMKFQDNSDIVFVDISIDLVTKRWRSYLSEHNPFGV